MLLPHKHHLVFPAYKQQLVSFYRRKHLTCRFLWLWCWPCWPAPIKATVLNRTCDADLGRPFGGAIEHTLFDLLHLGDMGGLGHGEHFLNEFEDLRLVPLTDLHAVLKDHDDILSSVLRTMLGALLCCSWLARKLRNKRIRYVNKNRNRATLDVFERRELRVDCKIMVDTFLQFIRPFQSNITILQ